MKKMSIIFFLLALSILYPYQISAKSEVKCLNIKQLEKTSLKDKDSLLDTLEEIVPNTYGEGDYGNFFSEWKVTTALPFPETIGQEKDEVY